MNILLLLDVVIKPLTVIIVFKKVESGLFFFQMTIEVRIHLKQKTTPIMYHIIVQCRYLTQKTVTFWPYNSRSCSLLKH